MDNRQTQLVYAAQREQEKQRMEYERRRQQERRVEESYTPGTFAYRQRGCMDSIDNAVSNFYCGPKDTRSGKVARVLCGLSAVSLPAAGCGAVTGVLPAQAAAGLASAGGIGCAITPCVGHFSNKCSNTGESRSNTQAAVRLQPISTQPSSSMQQTSSGSVVAQVHRR